MHELIASIRDVREKLDRGAFSNEDQVSRGVVMRLLQQLGWDVFNPDRVSAEFKIGNRKVDYALLHAPFGPVVLIEVKDVGKATAKGEDQLFDYCSKQGVPLAVLTDGKSWRFYLPAGMGNYEQRRFAVLDLVDGDESECSRALIRYIGFEAVVSGQSHQDAQSDYATYRQQIVAKEQFAPVLESLICQADPRVVALFCDEVEKRCGIRPKDEDVQEFVRSAQVILPKPKAGPAWQPHGVQKPAARERSVSPESSGAASVTLFGDTRTTGTNQDLVVAVFEELANRDPAFCESYARRFGRVRRQEKDFPSGKARRRVRELPGGWWIDPWGNATNQERRIRNACKVAGVTYGLDVVVSFRPGRKPAQPSG